MILYNHIFHPSIPVQGIRSLLVAALLAASASALAQPRLTVASDIQNVGEIIFQQPKHVTFEIRNSGTQPLLLTAVNASCGCTQVTWPKEPIAPGTSAKIETIYDAQLLGTFQKELEVYTNAASEPTYLTLQGRVVTSMAEGAGYDNFPVDLGNVRLSSNEVEFDNVNSGDHPEVQLQVVNMARESYKPELMHLPPYLSARYLPEKLAGGRVGRIILTLDSERLKNYGLTETTIYLARKLGDTVSPDNEISVSTVLLPAFSHLSAEEMEAAPRMVLSADSLDFGDLGNKSKATRTILVTNQGRRPLVVSNVQVYGKALNVSLSNRTIQPGKSAKLKVTVLTEHLRKAKIQPRVLIIANDPTRPKTTIKVK